VVSPPAGRAAGLSRRALLQAGALAGAGVLLGGCASETEAPSRRAEVGERADLLAHERRVLGTLDPLAASLRGSDARRVRQLVAHDERHAAALLAALRARGAGAAAGAVASSIDAAPLARALLAKEAALAAYAAAPARLGDGALRVRVLQIGAAEAEHAGVLRLLLGHDPAPDAFAGLA
jgi:type IV pilus biogenesis protein CpaD/CtpE